MPHQVNWPATNCSGAAGEQMLKEIIGKALLVDEWDSIYFAAVCYYHITPGGVPPNPGMPSPLKDACVHVTKALAAANTPPTPDWATCRRELNHGAGAPPSGGRARAALASQPGGSPKLARPKTRKKPKKKK